MNKKRPLIPDLNKTKLIVQCPLSFIVRLETTLDCFASPWNSTKLHHLTKCCFSSPRISPYIWDHNSKTKAQIKKLKTCGSQQ